jgi:hypothetical protein
MSDNSFAFRRMTDPLLLPIATTATKFDVPDGYFRGAGPGAGAQSFWVCNANNFWVRLKGSTGTYVAVTDTTGWLFPPGFVGAFSTQFPQFMSTMAVTRQGLTAGTGTLEISYGGGV